MKQAIVSLIRNIVLSRREVSVAGELAGLTELSQATLGKVAGGVSVDSPKNVW